MNIILFSRRHGQLWNSDINLTVTALGFVLLLVLTGAVSLYAGLRLADERPEPVADWQGEMHRYQADLANARETARAGLDALALRVGQLQARMLRLDALGKRLIGRADLDGEEFDFDSLPATGGPQAAQEPSSGGVEDFIAALDALGAALAGAEEEGQEEQHERIEGQVADDPRR